MGAVDKVLVLKDISVSDVDFSQDRQSVLGQLQAVKTALLDAFNRYNSINLNEVLVEILNSVEQPLPNIRLYDPIFAHAVLHPPFELAVDTKDKVKGNYEVPQLTKQESYFEGLIPDFPDFDIPGLDDQDVNPDPTPNDNTIDPTVDINDYATNELTIRVVQNLGVEFDPLTGLLYQNVMVELPNGDMDILSRASILRSVSGSSNINGVIGAINYPTPLPPDFEDDARLPDRDVIIDVVPGATISVYAKTVDTTSGDVITVVGSEYDKSTTETELVVAGLVAIMLLAGGVVIAIGRTKLAGEIAGVIANAGAMTPMVLTDKQSMERLLGAIGERCMLDRLLGYISSAQGLSSIDPERGYKIMLILAYWFPDKLRVASTGDIYVSRCWADASVYFKGDNVYDTPIYRPPVNLYPFVFVGNTPDYEVPDYDLPPEAVFPNVFGYPITNEIETWISKAVIKPWSIF